MYEAIVLADGGAHGSVYRGRDTLKRQVAIKFIRPSVGDAKFVREQAEALARVESDHVVSITSVEDVKDPDSGKMTPAIIMPWLDGRTLEKILTGPKLTPQQVKRIGIGMILGMKSIHDADLVHGDFHFKNVMVSETWVKLIDILYYKSLADCTDLVKKAKVQNDRNSLRSLLGDLLTHIGLEPADAFNRSLSPDSTLDEIHRAFVDITNPRISLDLPRLLDAAVAHVADPAFVDGDDYAHALSDEIHDQVVRPLLETMIAKGITKKEHKAFLRVIWDRLPRVDQEHVCVDLATAINREVPKGSFGPHLRMVSAFGAQGWSTLSRATTIRLEKAIINDLIAGMFHPQGMSLPHGELGSWVRYFYPYFTNQGDVRAALNQLLRLGWPSQNYVGFFFMRFIPRISTTAADRDNFIQGLAHAVAANAWTVKGNLDKLPDEWQTDVAALIESADSKLKSEESRSQDASADGATTE